MLLIPCPWCGKRDETEFEYGGEAHIARPTESETMSDAQWADYLFLRTNPKGAHRERWFHVHGCRRWFNVARDTVSHDILAVYRIGERPPLPGESRTGTKPPAKAKSKRKPARTAKPRKAKASAGGDGA